MRHLMCVLRQRFVVHDTRAFRVQTKVEPILPAELETGAGERVVAKLRRRMPFREAGGMGGEPADHRHADGAPDVGIWHSIHWRSRYVSCNIAVWIPRRTLT